MKAEITYFEVPGKGNTEAVMEIVKKKAGGKEIKTVSG